MNKTARYATLSRMHKEDDMEKAESDRLANQYVRAYYNQQVKSLPEGYTTSRWHSSFARTFDYRQTMRAILRALGNESYRNGVEIGPGDGVWTNILRTHITERLHLIEQSEEMLNQAQAKLSVYSQITFEHADFMDSIPPNNVDIVFASRCFEYFAQKKEALEKIYEMLRPGGQLILITKNRRYLTSVGVQDRVVHSDQLGRKEMCALLNDAGFELNFVYPATLRWKVKYAPLRVIFDILHRISVVTRGIFWIPFLFDRASESYLYRASRPRS